jgi:hypothetical protein
LRRILPQLGWKEGPYMVVAASATAEMEWFAFANRCPRVAQRAYERLSTEPLGRQPRKQFPLRGQTFFPFWELEASAKERIWYAVDQAGLITIVAARDDVHSSEKLSGLLKSRRTAYEHAVAEVLRVAIVGSIDSTLRVPEWVSRAHGS